MNSNMFRVAVAAVAVIVLAFVGLRFLPGSNLPGGQPDPTATPTPSPKPTAYLITNYEGVKVTLLVPDGWSQGGWLVNNGGVSTTNLTAIQIWAVDDVYTDPCQWEGAIVDPPVGPTVDDLVTALENQLTRDATTSDVTLDGYSGKLVKMTVPADAVFANCDSGQFRSWVAPSHPDDARYHQGPGQLDDVYIIDVGGFRLVIDALSYPGSSAEDLAKLQQTLDTIRIEPPA